MSFSFCATLTILSLYLFALSMVMVFKWKSKKRVDVTPQFYFKQKSFFFEDRPVSSVHPVLDILAETLDAVGCSYLISR